MKCLSNALGDFSQNRQWCTKTYNIRYDQGRGIEGIKKIYFISFTGGSQLEHKTCDILAAEGLRLMRFDHRLIIDSFQKAT